MRDAAETRNSMRSFLIRGMDCVEEVIVLRREVGPLVGGEDLLSFDLSSGRMDIPESAGAVPDATIEEAVARTGLKAEPWTGGPDSSQPAEEGHRRVLDLVTLASGLAVVAGFLSHAFFHGGLLAALRAEGGPGYVPPLPAAFYAIGVLMGLSFVVPKAWLAFRHLRPDMNLLMTVAILGAVALGQWLEAATVSFLFALSLRLEAWSVGRARRAVMSLLDLSPARARVLDPANGEEELVPVDSVSPGGAFVVLPGERIPLDGRLLRGVTAVDESPITGESVPVEKGAGDEVFAGTINGDGVITVESTATARDTVLARIIRMVSGVHGRRAPVERWVESFAHAYTPAVMALAAATILVPALLLGQPWAPWIYRGLVLLVIACPCALVISTPVTIVAAMAAAARHGVLVKGGLYVEIPSRLRAIAFDKTGTLTEGRQTVVDVTSFDGPEDEVLARAAALEARSEHPIGRAIVEHATRRGIQVARVEDARAWRGRGIQGRIGGPLFWAGSHRFLQDLGLETAELRTKLEGLAAAGQTVVVVGDEHRVLGFVRLADAPREGAAAVMRELHDSRVERIVVLTGDNRATAEAVGRTAGADEVRAELLPEDKVEAVEELVRRYGRVAMVGDGINDAPAMARASMGIAMGGSAADVAVEAADVALMSDDLSRIPWLIAHSRRALRTVRQNIAFALIVKTAIVGLTLWGHASLWAAIAADMGASLVVIANGLLLLRNGPSSRPRRAAEAFPTAA